MEKGGNRRQIRNRQNKERALIDFAKQIKEQKQGKAKQYKGKRKQIQEQVKKLKEKEIKMRRGEK